jgi:hypothetical protein
LVLIVAGALAAEATSVRGRGSGLVAVSHATNASAMAAIAILAVGLAATG